MLGGRIALIVVALLYAIPNAAADRLTTQVTQLKSSKYHKVRLSALLVLSKSSDPRAIEAVVDALNSDSKATIRSVAAISLGRMLQANVDPIARRSAVRALGSAVKRDSSGRVRSAAKKALQRISEEPEPAPRLVRGSVFLNVGTPSDRGKALSSHGRSLLQKAVRSTISKHAPSYSMGSAAGELPTSRELTSSGTQGFYIGASVGTVLVRKMGGAAEVSCKVSVRVSPWTGADGNEKFVESSTASASGSARVVGRNTDRGIDASKRECVLAVAEEVTARQVVPFIRRVAQ